MAGGAGRLERLLLCAGGVLCLFSPLAAQLKPSRIRVSERVSQGLIVKKVSAEYPEEARKQHLQGTVVLRTEISIEGDVTEVVLISGDPILAPAAIEAVKQWKYNPYMLNGVPIAVETQVSVDFKLEPVILRMVPTPTPEASDVIRTTKEQGPGGGPRVRVSENVTKGLVAKRVNPAYPSDARARRIQGVVTLDIVIDREGNVYDVRLISGDAMLAPAAIDAVKQWKYKPYLLNGQRVEVETTVQINFTISGG